MMHALALAERNHHARRAGALQNQYADMTWKLQEAYVLGSAWAARAKALEILILELLARNPTDPLAKRTGKRRPNGIPETAAHLQLDRDVIKDLRNSHQPIQNLAIQKTIALEPKRKF